MPKTTHRFFVNGKRVATAVDWTNKEGRTCVLEVCSPPVKGLELTTFDSVLEWQKHCERNYMPKVDYNFETVWTFAKGKPATAPKPKRKAAEAPAPAPAAESEVAPKKKTWTCPVCFKGPGNDHRLCICRGFNYSVARWEEACGIYKEEETTAVDESVPLSFNKEDWTFAPKRIHTFPPGKYYIGDLCYVLDDKLYENVFGGQEYEDGLYTQKGGKYFFMVAGTSWGDGTYEGSDGKEFCVDAGIIGICPESLMAKDDGGGHMYDFKEPVKCEFKRGHFIFISGGGSFEIET